jgi:two-component system LytT family response regulator
MQEHITENKIVLSTTDGYDLIKVEELIYCRADDNYTHFYLQGNKHFLVSRLLKEFESVLAPYNFFRIHKSFLVNIDHIIKVKKADGVTVLMSNAAELPVSFRKKERFIRRLKSLPG